MRALLRAFQSPWIRFAPRKGDGSCWKMHVSIPVDKVRARPVTVSHTEITVFQSPWIRFAPVLLLEGGDVRLGFNPRG